MRYSNDTISLLGHQFFTLFNFRNKYRLPRVGALSTSATRNATRWRTQPISLGIVQIVELVATWRLEEISGFPFVINLLY
jgi:hypothetical protein